MTRRDPKTRPLVTKRARENLRNGLQRLSEPDQGTLTEYASKGMPMSTREELVREGDNRYKDGTGPWDKAETLDQIDLVRFEELADLWGHVFGLKLVPRTIRRLVEEVREARDWPTPVKVKADFTYEKP